MIIPQRMVQFGGQPFVIRGDFAAIYTLESITGKPAYEFVGELLAPAKDPVTGEENKRRVKSNFVTLAQILYSLNSTPSGRKIHAGDDPCGGFATFLESTPVPAVDEFQRVSSAALEVLILGLNGGEAKNEPAPAPSDVAPAVTADPTVQSEAPSEAPTP